MDRSFPAKRKVFAETMSTRPGKEANFAETSRLIRREIRTEANVRFLRGLPMFKTDLNLSEEMQEMLARLERAERTHSG